MNNKKSLNRVSSLPPAIKYEISKHMSPLEHLRLAATSRKWHNFISGDPRLRRAINSYIQTFNTAMRHIIAAEHRPRPLTPGQRSILAWNLAHGTRLPKRVGPGIYVYPNISYANGPLSNNQRQIIERKLTTMRERR